jgi:hypothetical protein
MSMQLTFDIRPQHQRMQKPITQNETWLDVSDIARGVGFTTAVQISANLQDELQPGQNEADGDYDQRLYDALWQAYFRLALDQGRSVTFNFICTRKASTPGEALEVSLRLRVEAQKQVVQLGLLKDF